MRCRQVEDEEVDMEKLMMEELMNRSAEEPKEKDAEAEGCDLSRKIRKLAKIPNHD